MRKAVNESGQIFKRYPEGEGVRFRKPVFLTAEQARAVNERNEAEKAGKAGQA